MRLIPTDEKCFVVWRARPVRNGRLELESWLHGDKHLEIALLLRDFTHPKTVSVALMRSSADRSRSPDRLSVKSHMNGDLRPVLMGDEF